MAATIKPIWSLRWHGYGPDVGGSYDPEQILEWNHPDGSNAPVWSKSGCGFPGTRPHLLAR